MTTKQTPQRPPIEEVRERYTESIPFGHHQQVAKLCDYTLALEARHARIMEALKAAREPQAKLLNPAARGYVNGIDLALKLMKERGR